MPDRSVSFMAGGATSGRDLKCHRSVIVWSMQGTKPAWTEIATP